MLEWTTDGAWVTFEDLAAPLSLEDYLWLVARTVDAYDLRQALRAWKPGEKAAAAEI